MAEDSSDKPQTLGLKTKVEEDFVSPLTAIKGALELLRDFPDLDNAKRHSFVLSALQECARLESGVSQLAESVYEAGRKGLASDGQAADEKLVSEYAERIHILKDQDIIEVDFTNFQFTDSDTVNAVYDAIEAEARSTSKKWYFIVNHNGCRVWPEAWVAFAHRGKKINFIYSLGTVQYAVGRKTSDSQRARRSSGGVEVLEAESREVALQMISEIKGRDQH